MSFITRKVVCLFLFLMVSLPSFAFPADPDESQDPPASIDSPIHLLVISGVLLMLFYFLKKKEIKA